MRSGRWLAFLVTVLLLSAIGLLTYRAGATRNHEPPAPLAEGELALFIQPDAGRAPILDALREARRSIHVVTYLMTDSEIATALKEAAQRGVEVRVMMEQEPYGGSDTNLEMATALQQAGVHFSWDSPTINYLHQKSIVVDGEVAFILTGNLTRSSFSSNRDVGVITRDPNHIAEILRVFQADWRREGVDLSQSLLYWAPDNSRERLLRLIDEARTSIDLEQSSMQDTEIIQHLIAAAQRGVQVRYLSTPHIPIEEDTNEAGRERLRQGDVAVRYLHDPYIHAKTFLFDRRIGFVGSQNMTANSLDFNRELGIAFNDPEAVQQLAAQFTLDWEQADSEPIPSSDLPLPPDGVISHQDALRFTQREMKVELSVNEIYDSGRVLWLMPNGERETNFKVVIFPSSFDEFPQRPDVLYLGETIRVSGIIKPYRDWAEIVVENRQQIEIVR